MIGIQTFDSEFKISVLLYHQIGISPTDETNLNCFCQTTEFYYQMEFLSKSNEFEVISLASAINLFSTAKSIDRNYVALTFDDGCESFYNLAYPIIKSFGFSATVYPITGFLGQNPRINSKIYHHLKLMSIKMIKELSENDISFGAHTVNHFKLTEVSDYEAECQISNSKIELENILGKQIQSFSYPHGKYNKRIIEIVKYVGFKNAVSCNSAYLTNNSSLFEIPRKYITFYDDLECFIQKIR
jgi:peptidoglycan/xylan/chitin deacetylase (PgdA/CDA1 family)